jgi:hypothetical protein
MAQHAGLRSTVRARTVQNRILYRLKSLSFTAFLLQALAAAAASPSPRVIVNRSCQRTRGGMQPGQGGGERGEILVQSGRVTIAALGRMTAPDSVTGDAGVVVSSRL